MQPMCLCIFSCRKFEDTFENTQWVPPFSVKKKSMKNWLKNSVFWAKIKQMCPMCLFFLSGRQFEDTFKNKSIYLTKCPPPFRQWPKRTLGGRRSSLRITNLHIHHLHLLHLNLHRFTCYLNRCESYHTLSKNV